MSLFKNGDFTLHSGQKTDWIIDCNAFTAEDINTLALIASKILPPFGMVQPVMRGGLRFAMALSKFGVEGGRLLIAEDVVTTGQSMEDVRDGRDAIGVCIFSRGKVPQWVTPLWSLSDVSAQQKNINTWTNELGDGTSYSTGELADEH